MARTCNRRVKIRQNKRVQTMRNLKAHVISVTLLLILSGVMSGQTNDSLQTEASLIPPVLELRTYVEESEVPQNRQVVYHLELSWVGDMRRFQIMQIPQPELTNLLLESSSASNKREILESGEYRCIKTSTYRFNPVDIGMAYISAMEIKYQDTVSGDVDALFSQRLSVKVIDPIAEGGAGLNALIYIILLAIFTAAVVYFIILFIKRRREVKTAPEPMISRAEIFHQKLAQEVDPKGTNLPEMTDLMSRIFRDYLSEAFQVPTTESNTARILTQLKDEGIEEVNLQKIEELFSKLDVIKFAGGTVNPAEFSMMYGIVENFLFERKKLEDAENA